MIEYIPMSTQELLGVLRGMADTVEDRDSFDGSIEYHAWDGPNCTVCSEAPPEDHECGHCDGVGLEPLPEGMDFWVKGLQRVGNSQGQGGMIFFGKVVTS